MDRITHSSIAVSHRLSHNLREYIAISSYLYVCFAALLLFKAATLRAHGIDYAPYGLAAAKSLILSIFILIGHKLRIGAGSGSATLLRVIIYKSVLFLLFLIGLSVIEEAIVGLVHHRTIGDSLAELRAASWHR